MIVQNGIAYADNKESLIAVKSVRPMLNYRLSVRFNNEEQKIFDITPYLEYPCYKALKDMDVFNGAYIEGGTVVWNDGEIDIAPETLYELGVNKSK